MLKVSVLTFFLIFNFVFSQTYASSQWENLGSFSGVNMVNYKDLKKNDRIKSNQIGVPITGKLMESPKQGKGLKKVILIWTNGSEVGMFDEHGSIYANQITEVERDGTWHEVSHS